MLLVVRNIRRFQNFFDLLSTVFVLHFVNIFREGFLQTKFITISVCKQQISKVLIKKY